MPRRAIVILATFLCARLAGGQEPPDSLPQAIAKTQAAFRAGDAEALRRLATRDQPDPWLVADGLLLSGEHDAAAAFAAAAPREDTESLPEFVASRRGAAPDAATRAAVEEAVALCERGEFGRALERASSVAPTGDPVAAVCLLSVRGRALRDLGRLEDSVAAFDSAAEAASALRWSAREAHSLRMASRSAFQRADWSTALDRENRALASSEARQDRAGAASSLGNLSVILRYVGDYVKAQSCVERSIAILTELGDKSSLSIALGAQGNLCTAIGDYPRAVECLKRSLELAEELGNRKTVAYGLGNLGVVYLDLGDHARALSHFERARVIAEECGFREVLAASVGNIGSLHMSVGDYPKALAHMERAISLSGQVGDRDGVASWLQNIGVLLQGLGDYEASLSYLERSLAIMDEMGDPSRIATALGNIGSHYGLTGDLAKARSYQERALTVGERLGDRRMVATQMLNLGSTHAQLRDYPKAISLGERALAMLEDIGDRAGAATARGSLGASYAGLGDLPRALGLFEQAAREAQRLRLAPDQARALAGVGKARLTLGDAARALMAARQGLTVLEGLLGGLGEEQAAMARGQHADLFAVGAVAAARLEDAAEMTEFLESGRAGALLETLGGRQAMSWQDIPEELKMAEAGAKAAQQLARAGYDRALSGGDRAEIRRAAQALDETLDREREAVARIQREAKRAAGLFYPRAAPLEEIEGWLSPDEALVLYGLCMDEALALVLTPDSERIVWLGKAAEIAGACEALRMDGREDGEGAAAAIEKLRQLLAAPLALAGTTKTVLVSPEGPLCYAPWAALFDVPVACVPSGTTLALLREEGAERGGAVLALGDPDYTNPDPGALAAYGARGALSPLPGTRDEAQAVGDVVLLGAQASEPSFAAALARAKRWRAVHFACHGFVKPEKPTLSSLALARAGDSDGFLSCLEVLRMQIPADLAVLSACETAKGKIVQGEGIVGLTRAFMYAGAPRVLCSLWKVDDEATKALMVKFYELWNPKDGAGVPAAEALRKAQDFIRSQVQWQAPRYWAAWTLWGLPE